MTNSSAESENTPLHRFWQPRFWPAWTGILLLRLLVMLPYHQQLIGGRGLGRLMFRLLPKRQKIAAVNLRICFPELDKETLDSLLQKHFESLGMSVVELALAWWASDAKAAELTTIDGLENLTRPLQNGQGIVLLSGHFAAIELTGRVIKDRLPDIAAVYRPIRNGLLNEFMRRGRGSAANHLIPKDGMRQMIRILKQGLPVWYASDQSYRRKYGELVPFFGEPAMTNTALTHIARIGQALVVPYFPRRLADGSGYHVDILPALENFPTDDPLADALRINELLEERIRLAPEQYYWVHRRFKDRPDDYPDPYS